jgi:hypothetical protein
MEADVPVETGAGEGDAEAEAAAADVEGSMAALVAMTARRTVLSRLPGLWTRFIEEPPAG